MTTSNLITVDGHTFDFAETKSDVNGNPRYIVHFLDLGLDTYTATKETKQLSLRKYNGVDFGGGFIFSSYNVLFTAKKFIKLGLHRK